MIITCCCSQTNESIIGSQRHVFFTKHVIRHRLVQFCPRKSVKRIRRSGLLKGYNEIPVLRRRSHKKNILFCTCPINWAFNFLVGWTFLSDLSELTRMSVLPVFWLNKSSTYNPNLILINSFIFTKSPTKILSSLISLTLCLILENILFVPIPGFRGALKQIP